MTDPHLKQFAADIRPLIDRAGGAVAAGKICGVTPQTVNGWLRGSSQPNASTRTGALMLLSAAPPAPAPQAQAAQDTEDA